MNVTQMITRSSKFTTACPASRDVIKPTLILQRHRDLRSYSLLSSGIMKKCSTEWKFVFDWGQWSKIPFPLTDNFGRQQLVKGAFGYLN